MKININLLLLALILGASNFIIAQDVDKDNELIPTFPVGLRIGAHNDFFSNTSENDILGLKFTDRVTLIGGFDVEVLRKKRWIITTGFFIKNIGHRYEYTLTPELINISRSVSRNLTQSPYWTYHLPIEALYRINKNSKLPFFIKTGLEIQHYGYTKGRYENPILSVNNEVILSNNYEEHQSPFTFGINAGVAGDIYLKDYSKFRLALTGHYHFQKMDINRITSTNVNGFPDATSTHRWTGNYVNLSLTYFPREGFLDFLK
ncbi:hypothetical protein [Nonlabens sp. Asnod3-A02]|uniref:hypothetical protein n=1 Tax=Nonlabens sp. Asnod3-A02 TaxID=3160579 RepID=UPI00386F775E